MSLLSSMKCIVNDWFLHTLLGIVCVFSAEVVFIVHVRRRGAQRLLCMFGNCKLFCDLCVLHWSVSVDSDEVMLHAKRSCT